MQFVNELKQWTDRHSIHIKGLLITIWPEVNVNEFYILHLNFNHKLHLQCSAISIYYTTDIFSSLYNGITYSVRATKSHGCRLKSCWHINHRTFQWSHGGRWQLNNFYLDRFTCCCLSWARWGNSAFYKCLQLKRFKNVSIRKSKLYF